MSFAENIIFLYYLVSCSMDWLLNEKQYVFYFFIHSMRSCREGHYSTEAFCLGGWMVQCTNEFVIFFPPRWMFWDKNNDKRMHSNLYRLTTFDRFDIIICNNLIWRLEIIFPMYFLLLLLLLPIVDDFLHVCLACIMGIVNDVRSKL
jgi:hypothetical protein